MKYPEAWKNTVTAKAAATVVAEPTKVMSRIDMSAEVAGKGLCPECKQKMIPMLAGTVPILGCVAGCRISLPIENNNGQGNQG